MALVDDLLNANARYAQTFPGAAGVKPALRLAVVACMDSRLDLFAALGLRIGDAHIIRNGGGLPTPDVLRSLTISQRALGTREIVLIHHTNCGMEGLDDVAFRNSLAEETAIAPNWDVPGFTDVRAQMVQSIYAVRSCPWLPHRDNVRGFIFEVSTGRIDEVAA